MELFHEMYSQYFLAVKKAILLTQEKDSLSQKEIYQILQKTAFGESAMNIVPHFQDESWPMIQLENGQGSTNLVSEISRPLSKLEKSWIKAILLENQISLFLSEEEREKLLEALIDVEPLFSKKDFYYFDQSTDGDHYTDPIYQENFKKILKAYHEKHPLKISYLSSKGRNSQVSIFPDRLEYSEKDDTFRLYARTLSTKGFPQVIYRLSRIISMEILSEETVNIPSGEFQFFRAAHPIRVALSAERNTVERFMLQFASYEKQTLWDDDLEKYVCSIFYNKLDEEELLIRILGFGPTAEILSPIDLRRRAKEKIERQFEMLYGQIGK